jgi:single-strand DNA-binding protein
MARGLNQAVVIGFVEREPEKRYTAEGRAVTVFPISASRRWTTNKGEDRASTEWFNVVTWGELAEKASQRVHLDQRVYAEGHVQTRSWEQPDGERYYRTEFVAQKVIAFEQRGAIDRQDLEAECEVTPVCLNRVMAIGNLGRDPDLRYTPQGQAVTTFSLAATRSWMTESGDRQEATEWFNVVAWGSLAEICNQYLSKGRRVYVEGELRTRGWQHANGTKHYRTELVATEMIMLGPRPRTMIPQDGPLDPW